MTSGKIIVEYSENEFGLTNTLSRRNADFINVKSGHIMMTTGYLRINIKNAAFCPTQCMRAHGFRRILRISSDYFSKQN
jgi:hypothetical protein